MNNFTIRQAIVDDVPLILRFIKELADYEKMLDEVVATKEILTEWIFEKHKADVVIGEVNGEPVGFALYFNNFSTFLGRPGIYLEDIYVIPSERGKGYGKAFIKYLAKLCVENGYGRLEWFCLDWNQKSIDFYLSIGAKPMSEWTIYRVSGEELSHLAK